MIALYALDVTECNSNCIGLPVGQNYPSDKGLPQWIL